ncbi:hypothetical protein ACJJIG_17360 [Microbulbifer sp. SSSA007]
MAAAQMGQSPLPIPMVVVLSLLVSEVGSYNSGAVVTLGGVAL